MEAAAVARAIGRFSPELKPYVLEGVVEEIDYRHGSDAVVIDSHINLDWQGTRCVGELIHPIFFEAGSGIQKVLEKFFKEIKLLSKMNHPNIVKFLGIYYKQDPSLSMELPVLVTERMECSLTQYLNTLGKGSIPEDLMLNILLDVSKGLVYLHEEMKVAHRDLSSNNVFLACDMSAKIADLGSARVVDRSGGWATYVGPRISNFMPPEVLEDPPRYTTAVDVFSFGCVIIHLCTHKWPEPTCVPKGEFITEIMRRQKYLDEMNGSCLLPMVMLCLTESSKRPASAHVMSSLQAMVEEKKPDYTVVFAGITGAGKSTAGNFFLNGEHFRCDYFSLHSVTKQCSSAISTICGRSVKIIDAPGFVNGFYEETLQELNRHLTLTKYGIHAVAFVMENRCFFEFYEKSIMQLLRFKALKPFLFVLLTHAQDIGVTKAVDEYIQQMLQHPRCPQGYRNIMRLVGNRVIMVESLNTTGEYHVQKSKEFMTMIKHIHQSNGYKVYDGVLTLEKDDEEPTTESSEYTKAKNQSLDSDDYEVNNMLAKLKQAKANEETLKVSYTTVLFSGSSGVGKTSLSKMLNKEDPNAYHHSTGVAESKHAICIKTTAVVKSTKGLQWKILDYDSMISYLHKHVHSLRFPSLSSVAQKENTSWISNVSSKLHSQFISLFSSSPALPRALPPMNSVPSIEIVESREVEADIARANSSDIPSLGDVWNIINFLDTGGQPEFVNILPAVSSSIALTFIVFNLKKSLDSLVHVEHNVKGHPSFEPYDLDCTNLEFIKRLMVSSENFNKNIIPSLKNIQREVDGNDSKICYVGTHALDVTEKEIQEIDGRLSHVARELGLQRSFWSSPNPHLKRLFPIDMFPGDKAEQSFEGIIEDIRDNIQKQVQGRDYYEIPITWFIFLLKIQKLCNVKKVSYISYQEAVDVWMDQKASESEPLVTKSEGQHKNVSRESSDVHSILLFFHFTGMLFYYHKVEGMQDFVFLDRQWLFEKLTELVEIKFTKSCSKKDISAEDVEKFTMEGRVNVNIIKNLRIDLQGIQPLYFIYLLDHLNIIAPINSEYFMPCVLPSYPLEISSPKFINLDECYGAIQHLPLLVGFKNGPMPHGFFCHLIVELFRNLPTSWYLPLLSTEETQHIYNNLITFSTTSGHAVSLFYKTGHLEIQVRHRELSHFTTIYNSVRCELVKSLRNVSDHLNLNKEQLCYGFYCDCKEIHHFAKLKDLTSPTKYICCGYNYTKLTEEHTVWLQEVKSCGMNSAQQTEVTGKESAGECLPSGLPAIGQEPKMSVLLKIVIPKVSTQWETLAYCLGFEIYKVKSIKETYSGNPEKCCKEVFVHWLTSNSEGEKTWKVLLQTLKEITDLTAVTEQIEKELISDMCSQS